MLHYRGFQITFLFLSLLGPLRAAEVTSTTIAAPPYNLRRWTTEDRLPQNTVSFLAQTSDGYIWAGTRIGLARFDGVRFTVFTRELQLSDHGELSCLDVELDGKGRLWILMADVLVRYCQGRFERFSGKSGLLTSSLQALSASRNGGLWVGTQTEGLKRYEDGKFTRALRHVDGLATDRVIRLKEDLEGQVWIGCAHRDASTVSWQRLNVNSGEIVTLSNVIHCVVANVREVFPDSRGRLWMAVPGELVCWTEGKLTRYDGSAIWKDEPLGRFREDTTGALWFLVGGTAKVVRFENGHFDVFDLKDRFLDRDIRDLLPDKEGNIWLGTGAQGLLCLQPRRMISLFTTSAGGGSQKIHSVAAGASNVVWLATGSIVLRFQNGSVERFGFGSDGSDLTHVQAVFEDRCGQVWAKADGGLFTLTNGGFAHIPAADAGRSDWTVTALHEDRTGRLWIGSDKGLLELHRGRFRLYTTEDGLTDDHICGLRDAPDGSLWVGTKTGGMNQFKDGRLNAYTTRDGLLPGRVMPLVVESDGTVWAGTPTGLNRIRNGEIRAITEREGLLDNESYSLLDDGRSHYWGHCNHGIFRVRQADLHAVADGRQRSLRCVNYGEADGMASTEGNGDNQPNAARMQDGRMWFPMTRGVVVFDPGKVMESDMLPPIVIEQVEADDQLIYGDGLEVPKTENGSSKVMLAAGRGRWLKIHYTANSFIDPRRVRFQYRLANHDRDWRNVTDERVAYYADLRPGQYRFEVKAANPHGVWNEVPAVFEFSLAPHFYETWAFYFLCATGVALAGLGIHHQRLRGLRRVQHLEQQRTLLDERARIARDLHDDLGANLTGIALKADLAQRQIQSPQAANQLAEIASSTRALVDNMRETVWALNPKHDTVESLARFLAQQVDDFVTAAGLRVRLELPNCFPPLTVPSPARYHIHMIVKEALHNAVKHAGAREVHFSLKMDREDLYLRVADDGQGFDPETIQRSTFNGQSSSDARNGLSNMRQRVESLGGQWTLESSNGEGTRIIIRIPTRSFWMTST